LQKGAISANLITSGELDVDRGSRLGEYILEEKVGEGGFCEVWRGRHVMLGNVVALKVATDEGMADFLRREGALQHRLEHSNIVRVLGGDVESHPPYLVTEFMEGGSLRRLLKEQGRLQPEEAIRVVADVATALQFAHQKGVVHRDVKPENILFDANGTAKVADFGFWRFFEARRTHSSLALSFLSTEDVVGGTLEYMSPEQRRGEPPAPSDDVYSLGVVLFECLTGRLPAPGDRVSDFVDVGEEVDAAFAGAYVRRQKRFQDIPSFINALRIKTWHSSSKPRRHRIFADDEKGGTLPKDVRQAMKTALRFLRSVGGSVDESDLRSFQRRGDTLLLLFSERLGLVEFLYSVSVKNGEVVEYIRRRRRR